MKKMLLASVICISSLSPTKADIIGAFPPLKNKVVSFTSYGSYNWTVPPGVYVVYPYGCGAGGGGGGGQSFGAGGGGGGSGQCIQSYTYALPVTPGDVLSISIGQGGTGGGVGFQGTAGNDVYLSGAHGPGGVVSNFPSMPAGKGGFPGASIGGTGGDGGGLLYYGYGSSSGFSGGASYYSLSGVIPGAGGAGGGAISGPSGLVGGANYFWQAITNSAGGAAGGGPGANSLFGIGGYGPNSGDPGNSPQEGACGAGASGGGGNAVGGNGADGCLYIIYWGS